MKQHPSGAQTQSQKGAVKKGAQPPDSKATEWHTISYMHNGRPEKVEVEVPAGSGSAGVEEARNFVQSLEDHQRIAYGSGPLPPGTTYQIETDKQGKRRLVRKRFSAL